MHVAVPGRDRALLCCVFDCVTTFKALYCRTSVKDGGSYMLHIDAQIPDTCLQHVWAPPLMEVLCYSASNAVMRSKYVTKCLISTQGCQIQLHVPKHPMSQYSDHMTGVLSNLVPLKVTRCNFSLYYS